MAAGIGPPMQRQVQLLQNMVRTSPAERSWEPMPLSSQSSLAKVAEREQSSRSNDSDEIQLDSARDCFRHRGGYICVDSADDLEDPEPAKEREPESEENLPLEPLPESIYGFAIASLVQDSIEIHEHPKHLFTSLRPLRIIMSFLLCGITFTLQILLVWDTKKLVTPTHVKHVREVYGQYERYMYRDAEGKSHTHKTINGYDRGDLGYFNASNFDTLPAHSKELSCRVPLSQPVFCFMILFVWTLTVLSHMRDIVNTALRIWAVKRIRHDALHEVVNSDSRDKGEDIEVRGMTMWMKGSILFLVQIPRVVMCCVLLWLGARWLIATVGFGDLLLNCVALEFILNLSALLYTVLVPYSGKLLVKRTLLPHLHRHENETCANMFGMLALGLFAGILVYFYMYHLQVVLPQYHWDVRVVCIKFLEKEMKV